MGVHLYWHSYELRSSRSSQNLCIVSELWFQDQCRIHGCRKDSYDVGQALALPMANLVRSADALMASVVTSGFEHKRLDKFRGEFPRPRLEARVSFFLSLFVWFRGSSGTSPQMSRSVMQYALILWRLHAFKQHISSSCRCQPFHGTG